MPGKRKREYEHEDNDEFVDEAPEVINGQIIPASKLKLLGFFLGSIPLFLACGYLLCERWLLPEEAGVLPFRVTWWGSILSVLGMLLGFYGIITLPFEIMCPKQLVFGKKAFQVARRRISGTIDVEIHIPYANIKAVCYEQRDDIWQLGIDLYDDDGTYAKQANALRQRDNRGQDFILEGSYTMSQKELARLLEKKRRRANRQEEEEIHDNEE